MPNYNEEKLTRITNEVTDEVTRAIILHPSQHSLHEAYGVILEEVDEFWDEVKKNPTKHWDRGVKAREELVQIAAMAIRAIYDVSDKEA